LTVAALFIKSFISITSVELGFEPKNLLLTRVSLPSQYRGSDEASQVFFREMLDRLGALPGVQSVASAGQMPMVGGWSFPPTSIETTKEVVDDNLHTTSVTPEYFSTMNIPVIAGRGFTRADRQGTQPVAVINEAMARRYFPDEDPIGRRVRRDDVPSWSTWHTVVGVVGNTRYKLDWEPFPAFFVPYAQRPLHYQTVILKTSIDPNALTPAVRETLRAIDPNMPALVGTLEDRINQSGEVTGQRFQTSLLGCLSALAALLAIVGIYGVLSYTVSQRSHEIGIRMAFGAGSTNVLYSVVLRGLKMAAAGLGLGLAITLAASRLMESLLFEVSPTDPTTLVGVAALVAAAAIAASYVPARRATRVDPAEALRQE
jgi:putative ABC transport system permease protein